MTEEWVNANNPGGTGASRRPFFAPVVTITALAALSLVALRYAGINGWQAPLMMIASTGYLMTALVSGGLRFRYGQFICLALFFCWLGDMTGPFNFIVGAGAFLVAHLMFVPAFVSLGMNWRAMVLWAPVQVALSLWSLMVIFSHIPAGERLLIISYTIVISAMVLFAVGTIRQNPFVFGASVSFFASDIFLGRWRYLDESWGALFCYPLYYLACILFASSVYQLRCLGENQCTGVDTV